MRIVSQTEIIGVNYNDGTLYYSNEDDANSIAFKTGDFAWKIGEYLTKERALQVMEEINNQWEDYRTYEKFIVSGLTSDLRNLIAEWKTLLTFKMPQD
jgi:hypothetical protein